MPQPAPRRRSRRTPRGSAGEQRPRWIAVAVAAFGLYIAVIAFSALVSTPKPVGDTAGEPAEYFVDLRGIADFVYYAFLGLGVWGSIVALSAGATAWTRNVVWARIAGATLIVGALTSLLAGPAGIVFAAIAGGMATAMLLGYPGKPRWQPARERDIEIAKVF